MQKDDQITTTINPKTNYVLSHFPDYIYQEDASSYTVIVTPLRNSVMPDTRRPSDSNLVLSKSNAKILRMRNALDKAAFDKHTQQLQKERNSKERLFLKNRKHILQRQSSLVSEMTALEKRNDAGVDGKQELLSASSFYLLNDLPEQLPFTVRYRSRTAPSLKESPNQSELDSQVSLPDIFATASGDKVKTTREKRCTTEVKFKRKGAQNQETEEETCPLDYWKKIREFRY